MVRKLGMVAKDAVTKLLTETSHVLSIEDFDDISALNEIGLAISEPDLIAEWDILCPPIHAGGIILYPPTLGAVLWIQDKLIPWFSERPFILDIGIAFALSRDDRLKELWISSDRKDALKKIKKWWRHAKCTALQLEYALKKLLPEPKTGIESDDGETKNDLTYGPLMALLVREFGKDRNYWLWEAPLSEVEGLEHDYEKRMEAEAMAIRKASAGSGRAVAPPPSPGLYNLRKLRRMENKLRDKWQTT